MNRTFELVLVEDLKIHSRIFFKFEKNNQSTIYYIPIYSLYKFEKK